MSTDFGSPPKGRFLLGSPSSSRYYQFNNAHPNSNTSENTKNHVTGGGFTHIIFIMILFFIAIIAAFAFFPPISPDVVPWTYVSCTIPDKKNPACLPNSFSITSAKSSAIPFLNTPNSVFLARANFDDVLNKTGWTSLSVQTLTPNDQISLGFNPLSSVVPNDVDLITAVGFLEGYLTQARITDVLTNANATAFKNRPEGAEAALRGYLDERDAYLREQIKTHVYTVGCTDSSNPDCSKQPQQHHQTESRLPNAPVTDRQYWRSVEISMGQHAGLKLGYETRLRELGLPVLFDAEFWAKRSEFGDTFNTIYQEATKNCWGMSDVELDVLAGEEHCSSVSKTTLDFTKTARCYPKTAQSDSPNTYRNRQNGDVKSSVLKTITVPVGDAVLCDVQVLLDFAITHDTWTTFTDFIRVLKRYELDLQLYTETHPRDPKSKEAHSPWIFTMTSYPGTLTSYDDYYVLPSPEQQMIVTETTNTNCDKANWLKNSPKSVSTSTRTFISSLLADSGPSWVDIYSRENSGTYNNQWMVISMKLWSADLVNFEVLPHETEAVEILAKITKETFISPVADYFLPRILSTNYPANFYWIAEQAPGLMLSQDVTPILNQQTYWPSFNRPYIKEMYNYMGFDRATEAIGDYYSYTDYARAQILTRDLTLKSTTPLPPDTYPAQKTTAMADLMRYMRFNDWENDPLTRGCPSYSVAARNDLIPPAGCGVPLAKANARGQTDVKVGTALAVLGKYPDLGLVGIDNDILVGGGTAKPKPTLMIDWEKNADLHHDRPLSSTTGALFWIIAGPTTEQQKEFTWEDQRWESFVHVGHPDQFVFGWVQLQH